MENLNYKRVYKMLHDYYKPILLTLPASNGDEYYAKYLKQAKYIIENILPETITKYEFHIVFRAVAGGCFEGISTVFNIYTDNPKLARLVIDTGKNSDSERDYAWLKEHRAQLLNDLLEMGMHCFRHQMRKEEELRIEHEKSKVQIEAKAEQNRQKERERLFKHINNKNLHMKVTKIDRVITGMY